MNILFEDSSVVVCEKPFGVISQYDEKRPNAVTMLKEQLNCDIFPVHRLDRTTGGVMVYAKSASAAAELSSQMADNTFNKTYIALVQGIVTDSGVLEDYLFFDRNKNKAFVVKKERKGVKFAKLSYTPLEISDGNTKLEIKLFTGRTHQIRVQFASRKMPLLGDRHYGAKGDKKNIALWSQKIEFVNPETHLQSMFSLEPSEEFYE